jgi:hypothetical protein
MNAILHRAIKSPCKVDSMKIFKLFATGIVLFFANQMQSQVSVNVNIGSPPLWGPAGYSEVQYYYLPDLEAYYDISASRFIFYEGNVWVHRKYLPARYRNYDLYNGYKVVMTDYHGRTPYKYFKDYKRKYSKGYRGNQQRTIGQRPGKNNSGMKMRSVNQTNNKGNQRNNGNRNQGHGGGKGRK